MKSDKANVPLAQDAAGTLIVLDIGPDACEETVLDVLKPGQDAVNVTPPNMVPAKRSRFTAVKLMTHVPETFTLSTPLKDGDAQLSAILARGERSPYIVRLHDPADSESHPDQSVITPAPEPDNSTLVPGLSDLAAYVNGPGAEGDGKLGPGLDCMPNEEAHHGWTWPPTDSVKFGGVGGGTAPWLTVNVSPAIVSVPPRAAPELAATLNATDPLPVPAAPEDTSMNGELLVAVHWQSTPWVTVTAIVPVPPLASKDWLVGLSPNVQAAADWEIVRLNWLMVTVPER